MSRTSKTLGLLCGLLLFTKANAERYPFDGERWQVEAVESAVVEHLGQQAMMLKGGTALLSGLQLTDGIIEFDISVQAERGFAGCIFRLRDPGNFEHFYIRPHQSGKPDANQYTPVYNGVSAWQLYHGDGFGAPVAYRVNDWMHIKLVFAESRAQVYIDSDAVTLSIDELKRQISSGGVGVNSSNFATTYFANFDVSPLPANYKFADIDAKPDEPVQNMVSSWLVSSVFNSASLDGVQVLGSQQTDGRQWTRLEAGAGGITNLARVQGLGDSQDTVFARVIVTSEKEQIKELRFGYSDSVVVYANDIRLYSGNNAYQSRDYRYLGTIGLFDTIYLPLKPGDNEIWFAVTEVFGGWGIQAQFAE